MKKLLLIGLFAACFANTLNAMSAVNLMPKGNMQEEVINVKCVVTCENKKRKEVEYEVKTMLEAKKKAEENAEKLCGEIGSKPTYPYKGIPSVTCS